MNTTKSLVIMLMSILMFGCAITHNSTLMNQLSLGMTKQQVIEVMGQPNYIAAAKDMEYLRYDLYPPPPYYTAATKDAYYVRLKLGMVESFGRVGDFDSTKDPTLRLLIQQQ
jgi:hypothetical protein